MLSLFHASRPTGRLGARVISFCALFCASFVHPADTNAVTLSIDTYLEGDTAVIPFLPVGTLELFDVSPDVVQFNLTPILGMKFDNLGLGLAPGVNENQLVLTPLTPDQMSLDLGGWLGFDFKINFDDKPMTPVSFQLSAPGLDILDFLALPASIHYPNTNFGLRFWYMINNDIIDTTAGNNTQVPEPTSVLLLGSAGALIAARRRRVLKS